MTRLDHLTLPLRLFSILSDTLRCKSARLQSPFGTRRANRKLCTRTLARAHTHARARAHAHEGDGWNRVGFVNGSGADKRRINTRTRQKPLDCDEPTTFPRARPTLYCALAQPSPPRWRDGGATRTLLRLCDPSTSSEGPLPFLPSFFFFSLLYMYIYFLFSLPSKIFSNVFTRKSCRDR